MTQKVWQIASGAWGRNYADIFLRYDVMLMGPGDPGSFKDELYGRIGRTKEYIASLASFCRSPQEGDYVLLRQGHEVVALGVVANNDYNHHNAFDDVYGWDIQHTRRIFWQGHLSDELKKIQAKNPLFSERKQIPTFTAVKDAKVLDPIRHLFENFECRPLKELPLEPKGDLSLEEFGEALFAQGLSNDSVDKLLSAFRRQRRLTKWYENSLHAGRIPSESEVIAHLVLPMLIALGWSEQLLAVEWQRIDLAAFCDTPTTNENCVLVCEAKAPGSGLSDDFKQAEGYVEKHNLNRCQLLLLTEGTRFYLYARKKNGAWPDNPTGYFNTEKLRLNHIIHPDTDPINSILSLSPARLVRA